MVPDLSVFKQFGPNKRFIQYVFEIKISKSTLADTVRDFFYVGPTGREPSRTVCDGAFEHFHATRFTPSGLKLRSNAGRKLSFREYVKTFGFHWFVPVILEVPHTQNPRMLQVISKCKLVFVRLKFYIFYQI